MTGPGDVSSEMVLQSGARSTHAFVTLVTNADYATGALALVRSIKRTASEADIVVLHTSKVTEGDLSPLRSCGCRLVKVEQLQLSEAFTLRHTRKNQHDAAPFAKGRKPRFHSPLDNFCKLRLWQLTQYDCCVFIDADAVVLKNVDRLFAYPEFSAAPNVYDNLRDFQRLNSGVFVAKPSIATFEDMMKRLDHPDAFWPRTDQTFLQAYFPDWHGLPVYFNMLQYVWFAMPALWDWRSIAILHYQYEKPWESDHPKADRLRPLIDLWHRFHNGEHIPDIADLPNPPERS